MTELTCVSFEGPGINDNLETLGTLHSKKLTTLRLSLPPNYPDRNISGWEHLARVLGGAPESVGGEPLKFYLSVESVVDFDYQQEVEKLLLLSLPNLRRYKTVTIWYERFGRKSSAVRIL